MKKVKFVLKQGTFEKKAYGRKQPGLDLSRVIQDELVDLSLAVTNDCCTYYPRLPLVQVENVEDINGDEVSHIPALGMVLAIQNNGDVRIIVKTTSDQFVIFNHV